MRMQTDEDCPPPTLDEPPPYSIGVIAGMALIMVLLLSGGVWSVANGAVTTTNHTSYALRPCSTCKEVVYPTEADCKTAADAEAARAGQTRTTGSAVYTCMIRYNLIATFRANPAVTCPAAASPHTQTCPQGYTGSWEQSATVSAPPTCTVTWSPPTVPSGACTPVEPTNTARLSWTPPTRNTDGSALTNLAGHRIHYGQSATALSQTIQVANPGVVTYTVNNLTPGTWYFAVRAYNAAGGESAQSNVISKVIAP